MEYGGEKSLNDLIEKRKEDGLEAFPAADIEKVALHVARGLQVRHESWLVHWRVKAAGSTKSKARFVCSCSTFTTRRGCCTGT